MITVTMRRTVTIMAIVGLLGTQAACDRTEKTAATTPGISADRPVKRFEYDSKEQIDQLFKDLNYTPEAWQAGIREVPRLYITKVPSRWRDKTSKEIDVVTKKRAFFRLLGPLVLHSNELIQADRDRVESIIESLRAGAAVSHEDWVYLRETATVYKVGEDDLADPALQDELLRRVNTLPPSLVLAQAAEESGWGTSRFAVKGNALFGMWTWGDDGVKPLEQRSGRGNYKIAAYETPLKSVIAYMLNLNTHPAYKELRARRGELHKTGAKVTGWELANTLTKYSERGQAYVDALHTLMKVNMLQPTDEAYLNDGPTILLIPVGEGVN